MSNKIMKQLCLMSAAILTDQQLYYMGQGRSRVAEKEESLEDRTRRERCKQMAIEKAKAKRERKALKRLAVCSNK